MIDDLDFLNENVEEKPQPKIEKPKPKETKQKTEKKYYELPRSWITKDFKKYNDKLKKWIRVIAVKNLYGDSNEFWISEMDIEIPIFKMSGLMTIAIDPERPYYIVNGDKKTIQGSLIIKFLDDLLENFFLVMDGVKGDINKANVDPKNALFFDGKNPVERAYLKMGATELYYSHLEKKEKK